MKTEYIRSYPDSPNEEGLIKAAEIIKSGGLVAFPTETVYGLGGSALDPDSAKKIYAAKGRPSDNPLIIHLYEAKEAENYAYTNEIYYKITDKFSPGPITVILPKKDVVPYEVTGGLDTVAIRIPSHPTAREFIRLCGVAVAAPSANLSGSPSPTCADHVRADLDGRIDMLIDGGQCDIGLESTIVKITEDGVTILRPGAITEEMLSAVAKVNRDKTLLSKPSSDFRPEAPGMKYRHYAPAADVYLVRGAHDDVIEYMKQRLEEDESAGIVCTDADKDKISGRNVIYLPNDANGQARSVFDALRSFNGTDAKRIYCITPSRVGIGFALYNRLLKASGFKHAGATVPIPVIGLTGQSGAGKSTAAKAFADAGAYVADCDKTYASLLYKNSPLIKELKKAFPTVIKHGLLDRAALSKIVFSDKEKLALLNKITHKVILDDVRAQLKRAYKDGYRLAAVDASQLFEAAFDRECTAVIGVCAAEETRIKRIMIRDNITEAQAKARLGSQHNEDFFRVYCDVTLDNDGTEKELYDKAFALAKEYAKGEEL
ncbi:MAG: threonylcarbamoyl-AMP synthase [Clostridia bacterium]|nr:threonylcarbamoyl-AMP synthase [Clostridia bacterium]